jgi:DNA (cytosine-5)-methyltransferase 1
VQVFRQAIFTKDKEKVFSCFACGGGSGMGYKLAGLDVVGINEIANDSTCR